MKTWKKSLAACFCFIKKKNYENKIEELKETLSQNYSNELSQLKKEFDTQEQDYKQQIIYVQQHGIANKLYIVDILLRDHLSLQLYLI